MSFHIKVLCCSPLANLETSLKMCFGKSAFLDHEDILVLTLECPSQVCYAFRF